VGASEAEYEPWWKTLTLKDVVEGRAYIRIPPEGRVKLCELAGAPWSDKDQTATLSDLQKEVLMRPEREKIVHGGSGLGKSVLGGCEGIIEAMLPNAKFAVVSASYDHVANEWAYIDKGLRTLFRSTPQVFERLKFRHSQNYHEYEVETVWGSRGIGVTTHTDEGAQLLGKEFTRVILGEGSNVSRSILERRIARALDRSMMKRADGSIPMTGYLSIYTTPREYSGCSAFEVERCRKATKGRLELLHYPATSFAESVWFREASVLENPGYSREAFEARKRTLDKDAFQEQYLGRMTLRTGRVYKSYDEENHRATLPAPAAIRAMRLGIGIDTGAYTGLVLCGIDRDNRIWGLLDTYTIQQTINDSLDDFGDRILEALGPAFPGADLTEILLSLDVAVVDPASQSKLEIMDHWPELTLTIPSTELGGKLELIPSVDMIEDMFDADRIRITNEWCDELHEQLRRYVWREKKSPGRDPIVVEPRKEYDHLCDAFRMIALVLRDMGPAAEPPAPVTLHEALARQRSDSVFGPLRRAMSGIPAKKKHVGHF
jgi:hypothetical protein